MKSKLKQAEIAGDPQKIKDLEDDHNTEIRKLKDEHNKKIQTMVLQHHEAILNMTGEN